MVFYPVTVGLFHFYVLLNPCCIPLLSLMPSMLSLIAHQLLFRSEIGLLPHLIAIYSQLLQKTRP